MVKYCEESAKDLIKVQFEVSKFKLQVQVATSSWCLTLSTCVVFCELANKCLESGLSFSIIN